MFPGVLFVVALIHFVVFVGFQAAGRVLGDYLRRRAHKEPPMGAAVEGSLFGLLALMLAFTFSGGHERLDARRRLIVEETNAMGTAYLRVDLLPPPRQPAIRETFKQYADARIAFYKNLLRDRPTAMAHHERAEALKTSLWGQVVAALGPTPDHGPTTVVVVPAFNEMFDVTTARDVALLTHLPLPVFLLLEVLSLACAFFAGLDMGRAGNRGWMHIVLFAGALAVTAYVIADLEFPRIGLSQILDLDQELIRVRQSM